MKLSTVVEKVIRHKDEVIIETNKGLFKARTLLVTVSTGILQSGVIKFDPPLPQWKLDAIDALPMGLLNKIALKFDRDIFKGTPPASTVYELGGEQNMNFFVKPFQCNMAFAFVGGDHAAELEK